MLLWNDLCYLTIICHLPVHQPDCPSVCVPRTPPIWFRAETLCGLREPTKKGFQPLNLLLGIGGIALFMLFATVGHFLKQCPISALLFSRNPDNGNANST